VAKGIEGVSSPASSIFGSEEGVVSSFRFLEIVAFGSGAVFVFFKKNHLRLLTGQLAYSGC
jgi:hypothetical protein